MGNNEMQIKATYAIVVAPVCGDEAAFILRHTISCDKDTVRHVLKQLVRYGSRDKVYFLTRLDIDILTCERGTRK